MKFNPYSWSDSSSPKESKSITKTQVCLCRTISSLFLYYFSQIYQGKNRFGGKEITHFAIGIGLLLLLLLLLLFFFFGGGEDW